MSEYNTQKLIRQLRFTLNSEEHTPQEWDMYARQLQELAHKAHSRIPNAPTLERVEDEKK